MNIVVFGGCGFIGLNIAQRFLRDGHAVTLFDRFAPPAQVKADFDSLPGTLKSIAGDVTDKVAVQAAIGKGTDLVVMGAAITADARRDAAEPMRILEVNLLAQVPILERCRDVGVGRIINLSSSSVYGTIADQLPLLHEDGPATPATLYSISKQTTEQVGTRLASLWNLDLVNVRLSAAYGPWERSTGARDTLSPLFQVMMMAIEGQTAILDRPGTRDWVFSTDVADAIYALFQAKKLTYRLFNISTGKVFSVLDWGLKLKERRPDFEIRLAQPGEASNIDLFMPTDRAPMAVQRIADDLGWSAQVGMAQSVALLDQWWRSHSDGL